MPPRPKSCRASAGSTPAWCIRRVRAIDLVTEADEQAERVIQARPSRRPGPTRCSSARSRWRPIASLLDRLDAADFAIIVDPVDGTANFAAGLPLYATMASVVVKGETVAGIIYDPMGDDWVLAERGAGAFMRFPDGGARSASRWPPPPALEQMVGHVSITFLPGASKPRILQNLAKVRVAANYRVAGHDYRTFATGHCHFVAFNKLMPWDHLAGCLIAAGSRRLRRALRWLAIPAAASRRWPDRRDRQGQLGAAAARDLHGLAGRPALTRRPYPDQNAALAPSFTPAEISPAA